LQIDPYPKPHHHHYANFLPIRLKSSRKLPSHLPSSSRKGLDLDLSNSALKDFPFWQEAQDTERETPRVQLLSPRFVIKLGESASWSISISTNRVGGSYRADNIAFDLDQERKVANRFAKREYERIEAETSKAYVASRFFVLC
jgi:hypothetical protein